MKHIYIYLLCVAAVLSAAPGVIAYPKTQSATLALPENADPADRELFARFLQIPMYEDSEDKDMYYFVPPFRAFVPSQGLGALINYSKIEEVYLADKLVKSDRVVTPADFPDNPILQMKRMDVLEAKAEYSWHHDRAKDRAKKIDDAIDDLQVRRREAFIARDMDLVKLIDEAIEHEKQEREKIFASLKPHIENVDLLQKAVKNCITNLAYEYAVDKLKPVLVALGAAGHSILWSIIPDTDFLEEKINLGLGELKRQIGGNMALSVYSGFTEVEFQVITELRKKYWPNLKIKLLSANDLQFEALTEYVNKHHMSRESMMFKNFTGGGDYLGAMLSIDLTVEGARNLGLNLAPFYFPVMISGVVKEMTSPVKGKLVCDLKESFTLNGRADIRDGLVIYDNDISNMIKAEANAEGGCDIKMEIGSRDDARLAGLRELEKTFDELHLRRLHLSQHEAEFFYKQALTDIQAHRRPPGQLIQKTAWSQYFKDTEAEKYALARATEYFWHTSIYDTSLGNKLKFEKEFSSDGHVEFRRKLPTRLCLFFNANKKAYDSCTDEQVKTANIPSKAAEQAIVSEPCQDAASTFDCGQKRAELAPELKSKTADDAPVKVYDEI